MKKVALVAFNGETMCFAHALLNALDMKEKGFDVRLVFEGSATKQIAELGEGGKPFAGLYARVREAGLITSVCKACSAKMGALEAAEKQGLPIKGEMSGHPPLADLMQEGYEIVTF